MHLINGNRTGAMWALVIYVYLKYGKFDSSLSSFNMFVILSSLLFCKTHAGF